nr:hypothetical protein [Tanacetum cinerariifolium]
VTCDVEGSSCGGGGVVVGIGQGGVGSVSSSATTSLTSSAATFAVSSAACCFTKIPSNKGVYTLENPFPTLLIFANTFCVRVGDEYFVE